MFWNKKFSALVLLAAVATSLTMCSSYSVTDSDFLSHLESLESPTYKYAYVDGSSNYENVKSYPEKFESEKVSKNKEIEGKYEIKNQYETIECDGSSPVYNSFLFNARNVFSYQEGLFSGFEDFSSVIGHFFRNKQNRTLKKDPISMMFKYKGYAIGINYVDDGIDSDYGYYDLYGAYTFDEYGYPVKIDVSLDYIGYMQRPNDDQHRIYTSGRLRYNQNVSYHLSLDIVWRNE